MPDELSKTAPTPPNAVETAAGEVRHTLETLRHSREQALDRDPIERELADLLVARALGEPADAKRITELRERLEDAMTLPAVERRLLARLEDAATRWRDAMVEALRPETDAIRDEYARAMERVEEARAALAEAEDAAWDANTRASSAGMRLHDTARLTPAGVVAKVLAVTEEEAEAFLSGVQPAPVPAAPSGPPLQREPAWVPPDDVAAWERDQVRIALGSAEEED